MKKMITSAFIIAITIGAAQAQTKADRPANEMRKEHKMAYDKLNLTADQKTQLQSLRADEKKQMADLKNNSAISEADQKSRRKELHQQYRTKMEALLTPAQKQQWTAMKADRKATRKEGDGRMGKKAHVRNGKGGNGFSKEAFQKELNLSANQQSQLTKISSDYKEKRQSLRNDASLATTGKKEKMQQLMKAQRQEMKTVLTPEQLQKWHSLQQERKNRNTK